MMSRHKLNIIVMAYKARMKKGETFEEITASYPKLNEDDIAYISERLS